MSYRLAVTIAGAVSLGSYEAGVLYEIVDAIAQHNQQAEAGERICIDVLTGASAGGMSATVLAQKLLYEADALREPYANALYSAWVLDVDLSGLLSLQKGEDPSHSIFSSNLVESISKKLLSQRYSSDVLPAIKKHPVSASTLQLGLALSNLNGVDYSHAVKPDGTFTYTRFQDQMQATINADAACDRADFWEPLRKAAVSCGAFPFAFRTQALERRHEEFDSENVVFPSPMETFTYTDGGVFQNEPLGLAKNLVDIVDNHVNNESRFYLFIAPHVKGSSASQNFSASNADFKSVALRLVSSVYGQAEFQDWAQALTVNQRIHLFNQRASQLKDLLKNKRIAIDPLAATASILLPLLFASHGPEDESLEAARARLKQQFHADYADLEVDSGPVADGWIDSILTFETAAELGERDEMVIYGITAEAEELASAQLVAFVGFFQQAYRDHDYDVGRTKAQLFLKNTCLGTPSNLPVIKYQPKPIRDIDHSLDGLTLAKVPRDAREKIKNTLRDRANDLLKEAGVSLVVREGIELFLIGPQLTKFLEL